MRDKLLIGMGLLMTLGAFTFLFAATRTVVCEVLYQET